MCMGVFDECVFCGTPWGHCHLIGLVFNVFLNVEMVAIIIMRLRLKCAAFQSMHIKVFD